MSNDKPWWDGVKLPDVSGHFHQGWAGIGMVQQAIKDKGPTARIRGNTASLKDEDTIEAWIERFEKEFPQLHLVEETLGSRKNDEWEWQYNDTQSAVRIGFDGDRKLTAGIVSTSATFHDSFKEHWKAHTTKTMPKGRVHVLITTNEGPDFKSMGIGGEDLVRDNYSDEVLEGYDRIVRDMNADAPRGRVAILNGEPGTGKTFIVRGLLNDVKNSIMVIVPANLVVQLSQPGMIPALVQLHKNSGNRPIIFLIEDADEVLATRMGDNMSAVSSILNLGDGILGKLLDIRIVATTNAKHQDLDAAIMRPGRLSAHVTVGPLPFSKAQEVFERLVPGQQLKRDRAHTLAEIYQQAFDSGWTPPKQPARLGFTNTELEEDPGDDDFDPYD